MIRPSEALARVDLFAPLPREIIDELVQRGATRKYNPGTAFITQGSSDSGLQLILEGTATVVVNGVERRTLGEGDYLGEISLLDAAPRSATVVAGPSGASTFSVSPLAFTQVLDANPSMARTLLAVLTARIRSIESAPPPAAG